MINLSIERASDSDIQQIIDSTEKGATMFVAVHAFYLMAKELKALREAGKVPVADVVAWHKPGEERTCDIRWRRFDVVPGPLFTAPQLAAMVTEELLSSMEEVIRISDREHEAWTTVKANIKRFRSGMLESVTNEP